MNHNDENPGVWLDYRQLALYALFTQAEADRSWAMTSLATMLNSPAGVGDHSTDDLKGSLNEALSNLADANDRISVLTKYFQEDFNAIRKFKNFSQS